MNKHKIVDATFVVAVKRRFSISSHGRGVGESRMDGANGDGGKGEGGCRLSFVEFADGLLRRGF